MSPSACCGIIEGLFDRIERVRRNARLLENSTNALIDFIAVTATSYHYNKEKVSELLKIREDGGCVVGAWSRTDKLSSLLINSFLSHSLEFDDWIPHGFVHAGSAVIPMMFSCDRESLTLEKVLEAVAVGYEVSGALGFCLGRKFYEKYHTTAVAGVSGALVSYLWICDEDPNLDKLIAGISLGLNYSGGLWSLVKSKRSLKPLSPSYASSLAYLLWLILEKVLSRENIDDISVKDVCKICIDLGGACEGDLPEKHFIELNEFKFFPSCRHTHTAIEAALKARERLKDVSKIKRIEVLTFREALNVANVDEPKSLHELRFSLSHLIAIAIIYGEVTLSSLERGLKDPKVRRVARLVRVKADDELSKLYPEYQPSEIIVYLDNEAAVRDRVMLPLGSASRDSNVKKLVLEKAYKLLSDVNDTITLDLTKALTRLSMRRDFREVLPGQCRLRRGV